MVICFANNVGNISFCFFGLDLFPRIFCRLFAQQTTNNANRRSAPNNSPHITFFHTCLFVIVFIKWKRKYFLQENVMFSQQKNGGNHCSLPLLTFAIFMTPFFSHCTLLLKGQLHEIFGLMYFSLIIFPRAHDNPFVASFLSYFLKNLFRIQSTPQKSTTVHSIPSKQHILLN
jgi:hypothetical protein